MLIIWGRHLHLLIEERWPHSCITFKKVLANTVEDAQKLKKLKKFANLTVYDFAII